MYGKRSRNDNDYEDRLDRDPSTGVYRPVRHYRDGRTTYDFGFCGKVTYDENGDECDSPRPSMGGDPD